MNPLLLPEYLMEKFKKWSERISETRGGQPLSDITIMGLLIALGIFLSGALYVGTYFEAVPPMINLSPYGYGVYFFYPRALPGGILEQTRLETVYVLLSYLFSGMGTFLLIKGSKAISKRNTTMLFGIILIGISILMIMGLDYLKINSLR
ncbi:MAG: hypothetical protein ACUVQY_05180 [Thermoproteota archaeon]